MARLRIDNALVKSLALPEPSAILEVGCGTGGNLEMLSGFGNVQSIEQDDAAAEMARERNVAPVHAGELPDALPDLQSRFDLVAILDVIEHVEQDIARLRAIASMLNPGGRIVLTVPAFNFLWSQHDDENHHQRRYRRDLQKFSRQSGLSIDYISYFNIWLFPPVKLVRLLRKIVPYRGVCKDMEQPGRWVNKLLQTVFASERHLIGRKAFPFGISLVAIMSTED